MRNPFVSDSTGSDVVDREDRNWRPQNPTCLSRLPVPDTDLNRWRFRQPREIRTSFFSLARLALLGLALVALFGCSNSGEASIAEPKGASSGKNTFVLFYTDNGPPGAEMQPIVDGLQTRFEAQIAFDAIDAATESGSKTLAVYGLRGHPSYLILDTGGALLWSFSGQISEPNLEQQLDKYSQ